MIRSQQVDRIAYHDNQFSVRINVENSLDYGIGVEIGDRPFADRFVLATAMTEKLVEIAPEIGAIRIGVWRGKQIVRFFGTRQANLRMLGNIAA
mgnify:CR=1 FL=1